MKHKKIIGLITILLLFTVVSAFDQKVFQLSLVYDKGIITNEGLLTVPGVADDKVNNFGMYRIEFISIDGTVRYENKFDFFKRVPFAEYEDERTYAQQTAPLELILPYYEDIAAINIYEEKTNQNVLSIPLGSVCNQNHVCEDEENEINCPSDCTQRQSISERVKGDENVVLSCSSKADGVCIPSCANDPDCKKDETRIPKDNEIKQNFKSDLTIVLIIIGVILIVTIITVLIWTRKKNSK